MGRKFQGAPWTPPNRNALNTDGLWCKQCHRRHGYMSMGIDYYKNDQGKWEVLWLCPNFGDVLTRR